MLSTTFFKIGPGESGSILRVSHVPSYVIALRDFVQYSLHKSSEFYNHVKTGYDILSNIPVALCKRSFCLTLLQRRILAFLANYIIYIMRKIVKNIHFFKYYNLIIIIVHRRDEKSFYIRDNFAITIHTHKIKYSIGSNDVTNGPN